MYRDPEEADVLAAGFLARLPRETALRLVDEAIRVNVPTGATVYRDRESPRLFVVVRGLLRVFLSSPDGREVTIRHVRPGAMAGLALVVGGPAPFSIEAMTGSLLLALRTDTLRALLATDPSVARACAEELAGQVREYLDDIADQAFLSVRERLARQLLLMAARPAPGADAVVRATQQELADAIGSVREVVARQLRELHEEGLIDISRHGIEIRDPLGLATASRAGGRRPAAPQDVSPE